MSETSQLHLLIFGSERSLRSVIVGGQSVSLTPLCSEALLKGPQHPTSTTQATPKHPPKLKSKEESSFRAKALVELVHLITNKSGKKL